MQFVRFVKETSEKRTINSVVSNVVAFIVIEMALSGSSYIFFHFQKKLLLPAEKKKKKNSLATLGGIIFQIRSD